jgi:hypothetical protein
MLLCMCTLLCDVLLLCDANKLEQVIFALSPDEQFKPRGPSTRIPYQKHYHEYLVWLNTGLAKNHPVVTSLFEFWNDKLFPLGDVMDVHAAPSKGLGTALSVFDRPVTPSEAEANGGLEDNGPEEQESAPAPAATQQNTERPTRAAGSRRRGGRR